MSVDYKALKNGGFMPQKQKDYFSLRLHVVGGNLTSRQLAVISEVADTYGDGHVHLTSRQSVEIPFIKLQDIEEVKEALKKGDLRPGICGPGVRTVTSCQGSAICKSGNIDSYALAKKLNDRYCERKLPHKFKIGVTGCQNNCLKAEENDLGIKGAQIVNWKKTDCIMCGACKKVCRSGAISIENDQLKHDSGKCTHCGKCVHACPKGSWSGIKGYIVSFGGLYGNRIHKGEAYLPVITSEEELFQVADAAIQFFQDYGKAGERMRFTIERVGEEKFKSSLNV